MRLAHVHLPGITDFTRVSNLQQTLTSRLLAHKKGLHPTSPPPDPTIITFSPNQVYTTGRRDMPPSNTCPSSSSLSLPPSLEPIRHLLVPPGAGSSGSVSSPKAEYHPTLRGGQTTYHGPGQMVAYTILDLRRLGLTPRCHIRLLENSVIDQLRRYGLTAQLTEDPGVWIKAPVENASERGRGRGGGKTVLKKLASVGVHLRRNISSYGVGLNVGDDPLEWLGQIVACGLEGKEATSLWSLGIRGWSQEQVADQFVRAFVKRLNEDFVARGENATGEGIEDLYRVSEEDVLDGEEEAFIYGSIRRP